MKFYPLLETHPVTAAVLIVATAALLVGVPWGIARAEGEQRPPRFWWALEVAALLAFEFAVGSVYYPWSLRHYLTLNTEEGAAAIFVFLRLLVIVLVLALLAFAPRGIIHARAWGRSGRSWWVGETVGVVLLLLLVITGWLVPSLRLILI